MKVVFTPEAERQATEMGEWWRTRRPSAPNLLADELSAVLNLLACTPSAGSTYVTESGKPARRMLMPKTGNHVYFEIDSERDLVIVHAIWGAPRGRGPCL